ncbi:MAG: NmrA family NAD(P)-binding protein [Candidatus Sericytochromatia bacterium]|nr:NmrA family NAD(P)-binding protein [Candidatus Sericytochromatia bacterium]
MSIQPLKLLISGATGQVGSAVLQALHNSPHQLVAATRQAPHGQAPAGLQWCQLDFARGIFPDTNFDAIFLMRPPQLADQRLFEAFLRPLDRKTRIVFLSVAGAERKAYLPHAKIEACIQQLGFQHCFVRPGYFMENLLSTLWPTLAAEGRIVLPAGNLKLNWVSVSDIALAVAQALTDPAMPASLSLLNQQQHSFGEVIQLINQHCGTALRYTSPPLPAYLARCLWQGQSLSYTAVMLLLHYLPRRRPDPPPAFQRTSGATAASRLAASKILFNSTGHALPGCRRRANKA